MAPSQLAQLKSALASSGLSRSSQPKKSKTKGKAGLTAKDREKKQQKLDEIRAGMNKFDVREGKVKFDVGGKGNTKAVKGVSGRPAESRSKGLEQRKASLLPEHNLRRTAHTGAFIDRRFGESDPTITPEQRALERFTRQQELERRSGSSLSKKSRFNLNDDDDTGFGMGFGDDDGDHIGISKLTHGGRTIDELKGDDFAAQGLDDDDDDLEDDFGLENTRRRAEASGAIDRNTVKRSHFGGFGEEGDEEEPERKKSKAEVMAEVIAKSKSHKYQRQQLKALDDDLRMELDDELAELRTLLQPSAQDVSVFDPRKTGSNDVPLGRPRGDGTAEAATGPTQVPEATKTAEEMDYDQYVRALAFEARAKPKDRIKTEEELAKEEKERLESAERDRLRRMQGLSPEGSDAEGGPRKRRKGKGKEESKKNSAGRRPEADDLSDDFVLSGDEDDDEGFGLGEGIGAADLTDDDGDDGDDEDDEDHEGGGEDEDEDEVEVEDEDDEDLDAHEVPQEDGSDLEEGSLSDSHVSEHEEVVKTARGSRNTGKQAVKEIPFTFKCPTSHDDLLDIMDGLAEADVEVVTKRIRALYHPSLGEGNKELLQGFLGILLDHVLYLASTADSFSTISLLVPHIIALVNLNPITAAGHFTSKLHLMQKNLTKGLARGAALSDSRTFPRAPELALLRLVGLVWSTSDFSNPVAAPAQLLMGQYLAQSRIRQLDDVASGLFLCSLMLQYESFSKRVVPEAINFLASTLVLLAPAQCDFAALPGLFPTSDVASEQNKHLRLRPKAAADTIEARRADLVQLLKSSTPSEQTKVDLLSVALKLVAAFADLYIGLDAFLEIFDPLLAIMKKIAKANLPSTLSATVASETEVVSNSLKSSARDRRPLQMQAHKAVAIPTYTPKFESNFSIGKHYDPDAERNAAAKLKALYKKERKGAIRELRKDNKFLAGEKARERKAKDEEYEKRMRHVEGEIRTTERAEEKALEREKAREKRRSGR